MKNKTKLISLLSVVERFYPVQRVGQRAEKAKTEKIYSWERKY